MTQRYIRDGLVAVLHTVRHGAGWSTWNTHINQTKLLYDPGLVDLVLRKATYDEILTYVTLKFPNDVNTLGLKNLAVSWVKIGDEFRIVEYDGLETIEHKDLLSWFTA